MNPLLALSNLSAHEVFEVEPWALQFHRPAFADKAMMLKWAQLPTTDHCFLSGFEGVLPSSRVSRQNTPHKMRGLLVDYDHALQKFEDVVRDAQKSDNPPTWVSRSFSGGTHVVFCFESAIDVISDEVRGKFVKQLSKILKLSSLFPGLDEKFLSCGLTYLEAGSDWTRTGDCLPQRVLTAALAKAIEASKFIGGGLPVIPLDVIEKEVHERWPGRWVGAFEENSRGCRFWDTTADAQSAVIKRTGVVCYTGDRGFMSWADIFGRKFVEDWEINKTGQAIENIYWDGREYWTRDLTGKWFSLKREDLITRLKVTCGLTTMGNGGGASDVEKIIISIQDMNRVDAVVPWCHRPSGVLSVHGGRQLNTCGTLALQPADIMDADETHFPWIANFLGELFDPDEQLNFFLSWLKRFYEGCLIMNPRQGHTLFLAGEVNQGKTLLSNRLISRMVGGHADASRFLVGDTGFNKELFHKGLWTIDDQTPASDATRQNRYSSIIKKMAANQSFEYHPKFRDPCMVEWAGRVVVTCNIDPESIRILPDLDSSVAEKISAMRIKTLTAEERGFNGEHVALLDKELPFFCRWLLNWEYPKECLGDPRYGVKNYIQKDLEESALDSSESTSFHEVLNIFLKTWKLNHSGETEWVGNTGNLLSQMTEVGSGVQGIASKYTPNWVGKMMRKLVNARPDYVTCRRTNGFRQWTIAIFDSK